MPASLAAEESGSGRWAAAGVTPQRRAGSWGSCLCHLSETASVCVRARSPGGGAPSGLAAPGCGGRRGEGWLTCEAGARGAAAGP